MLPHIPDYPLVNAATELPTNRTQWTTQPERSALLIHDMQRYFLRPFGEDSAIVNTLLHNISQLISSAHELGIPVFYTAQPPRQRQEDRRLLTDFWGPGLQDDESARICAELSPTAEDTVLRKWRYDAFERSDFATQLEQRNRDQLVIVGVYTNIGVLATATSAFMKDIQVFLASDATADLNQSQYHSALERAALHCAHVLSTDVVLQQWNQRPA